MFSVHKKTKSHRFQIPPILLCFRDGLVWTVGLTGEVKVFKFLRRRNTRYMELQKPSTCRATFVSLQVLGRCFAFFTSCDPLVAQQKHLLRIEEMQRAHWLICFVWLQENEQQSQNLSLKVHSRSTFRNNFLQHSAKVFCCATRWSRKVKNAKHGPKTCNQTMLRDKLKVLYFVFRRL